MFKDQTILITGGTGSWGRELTRQLLEQSPKNIIIFSRGEIMQVDMERKFNDSRVEFVIGDVRDYQSVNNAMRRGVDYVFHLAALKHVPICEYHIHEAIETNIRGTENVVKAAIEYKIKKFIDVSTDKAVDPVNTYGYTKGVGERITIQANCQTLETDFICIRGGNVLGTNGSLIPYVIEQIKTKNEVTITDPSMTRFFLTLNQAIKLLLLATEYGKGGETFVMRMPSFFIKDVVDILVEYYGNSMTSVKTIGAREGEKINEVLISEQEINRTVCLDENYYCIIPSLNTRRDYFYKSAVLKKSFTSADNLKDKQYLTKLLKQGGWLL